MCICTIRTLAYPWLLPARVSVPVSINRRCSDVPHPWPQHVINLTSRSGRVLAIHSTYIPKYIGHGQKASRELAMDIVAFGLASFLLCKSQVNMTLPPVIVNAMWSICKWICNMIFYVPPHSHVHHHQLLASRQTPGFMGLAILCEQVVSCQLKSDIIFIIWPFLWLTGCVVRQVSADNWAA